MRAATWDDVTEATVLGQIVGYELGVAHGLRLAAVERDAERLHAQAAAVVAAAAEDIGVPAARDRADRYEDAQGPARRWSA